MMKFTTQLLIYWIAILSLIYFAVSVTILSISGESVNGWLLTGGFLLLCVFPPAVVTAIFYKRLDYMESEDLNPPQFKGRREAVFRLNPHSSHPFDDVMLRIDRRWIISFSDRKNHILKFRTDSRMMAWGVGGYLKMNDDLTVQIVVYPVSSSSLLTEKVMESTLASLRSLFAD
jgi:hypothetical protein